MNMKSVLLEITAALLLLIHLHPVSAGQSKAGTPPVDSLRAIITATNKTYGEAYGKGDSSLFINCYAPDACIMPANTPTLCGRAGFLALFRAGYKMGIRNIVFTTKELYGLTDSYVTEEGVFEMLDGDNRSLGKGKYLVLWKKTPLGWKMFRDMFNNDKIAGQPTRVEKQALSVLTDHHLRSLSAWNLPNPWY
jgi:ketosteroid isomerase-like protein